MHLSLIIPAYNEATRIGNTLVKADSYLSQQPYSAEIIVVNDGSTDSTVSVVETFLKTASVPGTIISLPLNEGKGAAVRHGMLHAARGGFRFYYDADASTPIDELERCQPLFSNQADIIIGSRSLPDSVIEQRQAWYREHMGRCFNRIERLLHVTHFKDTQCGFKGFTREAAEICFSRQTIARFSFDAELLFIARKHGLRVEELPVTWRNSRKSKVNPITDALRMFFDLLTIRTRNFAGKYE